jgi:hypothetical protein
LAGRGYLADVVSLKPDAAIQNWFAVLLPIAFFGLLGAIVSAITAVPNANVSARIPEMASSFRIMVLRLFMGPASAIVLFLAMRSTIASSIVRVDQLDGYAILLVAFAAGFSERFVTRVVQHLAGDRS